jgi:hypothetical protein
VEVAKSNASVRVEELGAKLFDFGARRQVGCGHSFNQGLLNEEIRLNMAFVSGDPAIVSRFMLSISRSGPVRIRIR